MKTYFTTFILEDGQSEGVLTISARGKKHAKKIIDKMLGFSEETKERMKDGVDLLKEGEFVYVGAYDVGCA